MKKDDWEQRLSTIPYVSVVDSKSLHDCVNKLICTYAQVEDKRTAIDVAILKDDLNRTAGHLRWVDGQNMIADSLTKVMKSDFLRIVCNKGFWSLKDTGSKRIRTEHDLLMVTVQSP